MLSSIVSVASLSISSTSPATAPPCSVSASRAEPIAVLASVDAAFVRRHYGKSDDPRADRRSPEAIVRILGKVRRPLPIRLRSQRTIHGLSCSSVFPLFPIISTPHNRVLNLVKLLIHTPKLHCSLNLSYNIRGNWFLSLTCEQRIDVQRLAALTIPPGVMHGP